MKLPRFLFAAALLAALPVHAAPARNVVIFVADGLRYSSVTPQIAPALYSLRASGVDFQNSHAMYPTLTTANASAIATGHSLGDTGDFANVLYFGFGIPCKSNSPAAFLEDDCVLAALNEHFGGNYLGESTLIEAARKNNIQTAVIGKLGPAAIQDIAGWNTAGSIIVDDWTGAKDKPGIALPPDLAAKIQAATGLDKAPDSAVPNTQQQAYFLNAATKAILPQFKNDGRPFLLVFWSRDPDNAQHKQTDADPPGSINPGINGETAHKGISNADANLKGLLDALHALGLDKNTDVFVTADHGFSTIAKSVLDGMGKLPPPEYPAGFLSVQLAQWLGNEPLFDADTMGEVPYSEGTHPGGSGLIGADAHHPDAVVAPNGGSDLIYLISSEARSKAAAIYRNLLQQNYVGAVFVKDELLDGHQADFPGALPLSAINMRGKAKLPEPDMIVGFTTFDNSDCKLGPQLCAVELADTPLTVGQGMHGSFSRADTRNFMAAIGPDFKAGFADPAPVSNADIAPTVAHLLRIALPSNGTLKGRVAGEALKGGKPASVTTGYRGSESTTPDGRRQYLDYQQVGGTRYFDAAGFPGRTVGLSAH